MRTGAVCSIGCIAVDGVHAGVAGIGLSGYVAIADYKAASQIRKNRFLGERHGSQAIAGASGEAVNIAEHMQPQNQLAFSCSLFPGIRKRS